ncbi:hypothetical protein Y1Q_0010428 [Alligator mississippiensis]|uniref:Ig-like domain-containing protein n=1 Tax=Alligator mississippiensis TaxID=8496 RepID=A0A151MVF6_ALLMI|nr:hypothetical protein Y1Q_0010428 [Alligator mississippiensis]
MVQDHGARVRCVFLHEGKRIREERVFLEIQVWGKVKAREELLGSILASQGQGLWKKGGKDAALGQCLGTLLLPVALLLSPLFAAPHGSQLQVTTAPSSMASSNFSYHVHHEVLEQPLEEQVPAYTQATAPVGPTGSGVGPIEGMLIVVGGGAILVIVIKGGAPAAASSYFCRKRRKGAAMTLATTLIRASSVAARRVGAFRTFNFWKKRSEDDSWLIHPACQPGPPGWAVSYNVAEVQGPERCLLGQEVTLRCSMAGTFPEDAVTLWEWIHSKDRMAFESDMDQESPEHQLLLPALPPGWRVTEERAGTCLTSSLTFTPTLQDDGARVRCVFLHEAERIREERVSPEIRVWGSQLQVTTAPSSTAPVSLGALLQCRFDVGGPVALDSLRVM